MEFVWPLFILIPGILFHLAYFAGWIRSAGILIPGGILTTYGVLFYYCIIFGWETMVYMWPFFIMGVAIGLLEFGLADQRQPGVLIAAGIIGLIGLLNFLISVMMGAFSYILAVLFILVGIWLLMRR